MRNLWTPWRIEHVLGKAPKPSGCLFEPDIDYAADYHADKSALLLYRGPHSVVLLNRFPYANGHLLVAPVRHLRCLTELNSTENCALMETLQTATVIVKKHLLPDGINIGCNIGTTAGAGIADHLHFHIVPRWDGDHNFISVLADVRTIPEHINATFERLYPDFLALYKKNA